MAQPQPGLRLPALAQQLERSAVDDWKPASKAGVPKERQMVGYLCRVMRPKGIQSIPKE